MRCERSDSAFLCIGLRGFEFKGRLESLLPE